MNYNHTTVSVPKSFGLKLLFIISLLIQRLLAQTHLRNILGQKSLQDILNQREEISRVLQRSLDEATDDWGIKVESVEVKDIILPPAVSDMPKQVAL